MAVKSNHWPIFERQSLHVLKRVVKVKFISYIFEALILTSKIVVSLSVCILLFHMHFFPVRKVLR